MVSSTDVSLVRPPQQVKASSASRATKDSRVAGCPAPAARSLTPAAWRTYHLPARGLELARRPFAPSSGTRTHRFPGRGVPRPSLLECHRARRGQSLDLSRPRGGEHPVPRDRPDAPRHSLCGHRLLQRGSLRQLHHQERRWRPDVGALRGRVDHRFDRSDPRRSHEPRSALCEGAGRRRGGLRLDERRGSMGPPRRDASSVLPGRWSRSDADRPLCEHASQRHPEEHGRRRELERLRPRRVLLLRDLRGPERFQPGLCVAGAAEATRSERSTAARPGSDSCPFRSSRWTRHIPRPSTRAATGRSGRAPTPETPGRRPDPSRSTRSSWPSIPPKAVASISRPSRDSGGAPMVE